MFIDKYLWLNIEMNEHSNQSHIIITETVINGGHFEIKNVQSVDVTNCFIENNIPNINGEVVILTGLFGHNYQIVNFAELFPDLLGETVNMNYNHLKPSLPNSIMRLDTIRRFQFHNCTIQRVTAWRVIDAYRANGNIQKLITQELMYFNVLLRINRGKITLSSFTVKYLPGPPAPTFEFYRSQVRAKDMVIESSEIANHVFRITYTVIWINGLSIIDTKIHERLFSLFNTNAKFGDIYILRADISTMIQTIIALTYGNHKLEMVNSSIINSKLKSQGFHFIRANAYVRNLTIFNCIIDELLYISYDDYGIDLIDFDVQQCQINKNFIRLNRGSLQAMNLQIVDSNFKEYVINSLRSNLKIKNFTITKGRIKENAFVADRSSMNITNFRIKESSFTKTIFSIEYESNTVLNRLQLINLTTETILISSKSTLTISNSHLDAVNLKRKEAGLQVTLMNGFTFVKNSMAKIKEMIIINSKMDLSIFSIVKSKATIINAFISNNEFSTLLKVSSSNLNATNLKSIQNSSSKLTRLIVTESSSIIALTNVYAYVPELIKGKSIAEVDDTEMYMNNVMFNVNASTSLQFDILKWKFNDLNKSILRNTTIACPSRFNAMLDKTSKDKLLVYCQKCEKNTYPTKTTSKNLQIDTQINRRKNETFNNLENTELKCLDCPTGAVCVDGGI